MCFTHLRVNLPGPLQWPDIRCPAQGSSMQPVGMRAWPLLTQGGLALTSPALGWSSELQLSCWT